MRTIRTVQGDTVDLICHRRYGYTQGTTEAVLEANPGLANLGPVLPSGTLVKLPEISTPAQQATVKLWD